MPKPKSNTTPKFELAKYLETDGVEKSLRKFREGQTIYSQGDQARPLCIYGRGPSRFP
jgi:hypothetical protein